MPMLYVPDSWLGFATALVACQLLAAAWYSPALFGRHWRTALGKAALPASEPPAQARILAANAVMIYLLVSLLHWTASGQTSGAALGMATLLWLGFVAGSSA